MTSTITPVILSGGSGTRLWPLSRTLYPKQLLALAGERSMLQETAARVSDGARFAPPLVVCNDAHRFIVAEQLHAVGTAPGPILLEPQGRNTAPAIAAAAIVARETDPDAVILVLPSDHVIENTDAFLDAVATAAEAAAMGALVTFGITPSAPETGFGYVERGDALDGVAGAFKVARFVEKPDRKTAEGYLAAGTYAWNSGMFLFGAGRYLEELDRLEPDMVAACREAVETGQRDPDFIRLDAEAFGQARSVSIDYAVMEHTKDAAIVPADIGWNDVGAWSALWDIGAKDAQGNVTQGDVVAEATTGSYLRTDGPMIAAVGVEDMVVVATDDAVMVAPKDRAQEVKRITDALKAAERPEMDAHTVVHRPWGTYQTVDAADGFQVKRIVVKPGAKLSLQKHAHRAEHWVIVRGTGRITRDDEVFDLTVDEATYIPLGAVHRLENPSDEPLYLVEVQCGGYLGEDDIVRLEDTYGRS